MESKNLICPSCNNILSAFNAGNIIVDICKNGCGGIWFDRGELFKVDNSQESEGLLLLNIKKASQEKLNFNPEKFCPICEGVKMRTHFYSPKQNAEVDECDKCGGIWLDDSELEKIRVLFANDEEKMTFEKQYFFDYSCKLYDEMQEEKREKAAWYDKLAYALFGC